MTAKTRAQLKAEFETGDTLIQSAFEDVMDSNANLVETATQTFQSAIIAPRIDATVVSGASVVGAAGTFTALTASIFTVTNREQLTVDASASAQGGGQGGALAVSAAYTRVAGAASSQGLRLQGGFPGWFNYIYNDTATNTGVYPPTGGIIAGAGGANAAYIVSASTGFYFIHITSAFFTVK
jgi:hypothetical protein